MRLLFLRTLLLSTILVALSNCAFRPIGFWSRNRFDRQELRHGPWRVYLDGQQLLNKGRYRHGREVGRWQYFSSTGLPERTERFHRWPPGLITLTVYHPNGRIAKKGQARFQSTPTADRFFWFGEWRCYDTEGQPLPSEYYRTGILVGTPLTPKSH